MDQAVNDHTHFQSGADVSREKVIKTTRLINKIWQFFFYILLKTNTEMFYSSCSSHAARTCCKCKESTTTLQSFINTVFTLALSSVEAGLLPSTGR